MIVLGIESSCDETAAAVVEDGQTLLSNVVVSQIDIHTKYGGVVPEVAARSHIEVVNVVIEQALENAGLRWDEIDAIAVTYAPGLIGSLLVGTLAARTLAIIHQKPLYNIHHVEGHVYANFITRVRPSLENPEAAAALEALILPHSQPAFPMLSLIVSGGHTQLVLFRDHGDFELLGQTQDDAVGEAFDKVAKIIGLPYPGGPSVSEAAKDGDDHAFTLPKAKMSGVYDFSFSGLKTAVLRTVQREVGVETSFPSHGLPELLNDAQRASIAASFQRVAIETLVDKTIAAAKEFHPQSVVIAGGVAANAELRRQLAARLTDLPTPIQYAPMSLCTDNAAMIATLGYYYAQKNEPSDPRDFQVIPSLSMTKTAWAVS